MPQSLPVRIVMRLLVLVVGVPLISYLVYGAGIYGIAYTDAADKALLGAINPDSYLVGMDQFMRAVTDYTNFLIPLLLISYAVAYLLHCITLRRIKPIITGLLVAETLVVAGMAVMGKLWPNETYVGVNVMLVVAILVAFGFMTFFFYKMSARRMFRFFLMCWLMILSGHLAGSIITPKIKDAVARPRPLHDANKPWNETVRPIPDEILHGKYSFPSGHTSGTFGLLTPLFWYVRDRRCRAALFGWGCLQAISRVYTAAHFPFCVLMGGFLGFGIGTLIFFTLGGSWIRQVDACNSPVEDQTAC